MEVHPRRRVARRAAGACAAIALAAAPLALAAAVEPGRYRGTASPGKSMRLRVGLGGRVDFVIRPRIRCSNRRRTTIGLAAPDRRPRLGPTGAFLYRERGRTLGAPGRYRYRIRGVVGPKRASGRFTMVFRSARFRCRSARTVRWSARRR
jgi:hypothetical protein